MAAQVHTEVGTRLNRRDFEENYIRALHVKIDDLKMIDPDREYLKKKVSGRIEYRRGEVPNYPRPVEFHTSTIAHVTNEAGATGILQRGGLTAFNRDLLWWTLKFNPDADDTSVDGEDEVRIPNEISAAEQRYLEKVFPDRSEEDKRRQEPFLHKFTTSPVFEDESRYGNFRFSFPLEEVLQAYSRQLCGGQTPVLRVFETVMYSQEIMYSVLVHSPDFHDYDKDYPEKLGDNEEGVCAYRNGELIWRAQAISANHEMSLSIDRNQKRIQTTDIGYEEWYVFDIVTLALHVPRDRTLDFPKERLKAALSACGPGFPTLNGGMMSLRKAKLKVQKLKLRN